MPGTREDPIPRPTSRVILLDPADRVFLFCARGSDAPRIWFMPGGGLERGETHREAALRELWEETGLRPDSVGPCVWLRRHAWRSEPASLWYESIECYFLLRTRPFEQRWAKPNELEQSLVLSQRWWTADEIAASEETFVPRRLAALLPPLLADELPEAPVDVGI